MIKKTFTFDDYDGNERTEDWFFHFSQAEIAEKNLMTEGGLKNYIEMISKTKDQPRLVELFKEIIIKSVGKKSADGRRFIKSDEISEEFKSIPAYSMLFMELATNADAASEFINGIIPKQAVKNA